MTTLALDLGTSCGWAIQTTQKGKTILISGVWDMKGSRYEGGGMRFLNFRRELERLGKIDLVAYEKVEAHKGTDAAHIYGGFLSTITAFCEENDIPYTGIPVGTIKKHATGKGSASKDRMVNTAKKKWPNQCIKTHDQADALWILDCRLKGGR